MLDKGLNMVKINAVPGNEGFFRFNKALGKDEVRRLINSNGFYIQINRHCLNKIYRAGILNQNARKSRDNF